VRAIMLSATERFPQGGELRHGMFLAEIHDPCTIHYSMNAASGPREHVP